MTRRKKRSCEECIAYYNMLGGDEYRCGLGFEVMEDVEGGYGSWSVVVKPLDDQCLEIELPKTKEEFVKKAAELGLEWNLEEVVTEEELAAWEW